MKILADPQNDIQIKAAASRLQNRLEPLLKALRKDPKSNAGWKAVRDALQDGIVYLTILAYNSGCADVKMRPRMADLVNLRLKAEARAKWLAEEMEAWTLMSLGIKAASYKKKKNLLGRRRAKTVVDNETYTAFFAGKQKGWRQNKAARKEWLVTDAHDKDDICDDCQDDGIIGIDEPFSSGDFAPPAHINCNCVLWLHIV